MKFKFVVLTISGAFFITWSISLYIITNFISCEKQALARDATIAEITSPFQKEQLERAVKANDRPPLVRFKWYTKSGGPIHIGYGGETGLTVLAPYGFQETTSDDWDLLWTMFPQWTYISQNQAVSVPRSWQVHNHCFPLVENQGISGTKVSQWEHYRCMREKHGREAFWYMPDTIIIPSDADLLKKELLANRDPWILKPSLGKQGIGISVTTDSSSIPKHGNFVAQKYIANPLLVFGRKFHLRLYLVVTNLLPLRILLHKEGLVLFASMNYTEDASSYMKLSVHLTNAAVADRTNTQSQQNSMLLSELWNHLGAQNIDIHKIWSRIADAMIKLVLSAQCSEEYDHRLSGTCFDMMGVDVLIDSNHNPHIMETNNGPELHTANPNIRMANDLAHKAVLNDVVPLVMRHRLANTDSFQQKLATFIEYYKIPVCRELSGFGGVCLSEPDIAELWRLHYEELNLGNLQRLFPSKGNSHKYHQYFSNGLSKIDEIAAKWVEL